MNVNKIAARIAKKILADGPKDAFEKEIKSPLERMHNSHLIVLDDEIYELYMRHKTQMAVEINAFVRRYKDKKTKINKKLLRHWDGKEDLGDFYRSLSDLIHTWFKSKKRK